MRIVLVGMIAMLGVWPGAASAQRALLGDPASEPAAGRFWPWEYNHIRQVVADTRATPADLKAVEANMLRVVDLLKATSPMSPPKGYDIQFSGTLLGIDPDYTGRVTALGYEVVFHFMQYLGGGAAFPGHGLRFRVNDLDWMLRSGIPNGKAFVHRRWTDKGGLLLIEPPSDEFNGFRDYRELDLLPITRPGASVWNPVRVDRFLAAFVADLTIDAAAAQSRLDAAKKRYDQEVSAETVAKHQKEVDAARAGSGGEAQARHLEAMFRRMAEDARAEATVSPTNAKHRWYFGPKKALEDAQARLASLDADGRKATACVTNNVAGAERWELQLVPEDAAGCRRVVEPNMGLYDNKLPRTAIQFVIVSGLGECEQILKSGNKAEFDLVGGCRGTVEVARQLDWQKLVDMLAR
jgi:hypothetical protein